MVTRLRYRVTAQEEEIDHVANMFRENLVQYNSPLEYQCLRTYNKNNKQFSMKVIIKQYEEQQQLVAYHCIYRHETHEIKLEYDTSTETWEIDRDKYHLDEEKQLNTILIDLENSKWDANFTLDEQIQFIIKEFNRYFLEVDQAEEVKRNKNKTSTSASKKDMVDYGLHTFVTGSQSQFSGLPPRRNRQNSACSTQSSVRHASFVPPPTAPVRRRRVIESIRLNVQRKKKPFEKIVGLIKGRERVTMDELGAEFLRVYDGKFNYREGHVFAMPFRKNTWSLKIEKIKCVDCPVGDIGPRSVLILNYKGHGTSVHV